MKMRIFAEFPIDFVFHSCVCLTLQQNKMNVIPRWHVRFQSKDDPSISMTANTMIVSVHMYNTHTHIDRMNIPIHKKLNGKIEHGTNACVCTINMNDSKRWLLDRLNVLWNHA